MTRNAEMRAAQERIISLYSRKPNAALSCRRAGGGIREGLKCSVRERDHEAVMDLSKLVGGDETGPTPGFFIRAGLVGCVAIGIKLTAVREGMDLGSIDVDVEMDFDDGAMFGVGANTAAPLETRLTIRIQSPAPQDAVAAMVGRALEADPYFLAFRDAQHVSARVVATGE